eukprot:TRINITY_DN2794_c0_g2_i1.p1 TRINITY_DN2794_c0_g2~~TRINITY_DN2794_c0_g2_i1.p1  ORF type:complete len:372 (+),score=55.35 TRINITY_DN2794_c0_g2_i1:68-1183(+)
MADEQYATVVANREQSVGQNRTSPWEKLNFYEQNIKKYIQANECQFKRLSTADSAALKQDRFLMDHNIDELEHSTFQHDIRTDLSNKCQELRTSVENLALDVAEIFHLRSQNDQVTQITVLRELHATAHSVRDKFELMRGLFLNIFAKHKDNSVTHLNNMNSSKVLKWMHLFGALSIGIAGVWSLWAMMKHTPEQRQSSLFMTWLRFVAAKRIGPNKSAPNAPIMLYPLVPFILLGAGTMCTYRCVEAQSNERNHASYMKQTVADIRFMRENRSQWEGMEQLVKDLVDKVEKYQKLDQTREDRVNITLHEICDRLFNMRMSIDVYMAWLAKHDMFPANVSVPVLIGYESFTAINEILSPQKRASWLQWARA